MKVCQKAIDAVRDCAGHYAEDPRYFADNEQFMDWQWEHVIKPNLAGQQVRRVLEIAAGYGRNTAKLADIAEEIWVTDVNASCIAACEKRFVDWTGSCRLHFVQTDGLGFRGVPEGRIDFIYSWDSMVHFTPEVLRQNIFSASRLLVPGGRGFIHHANLPPHRAQAYWKNNPGWRSAVDAPMVAGFLQEASLKILRQVCFSWANVPWLDCMTLFSKR